MFGATRVLWIANKHLSFVAYLNGETDKSLAGEILAKEVLGDGELDFLEEAHLYRHYSKKEAACRVLVETAAAWKVADNERYSRYCLEAAKRLSHVFHAESDPVGKIEERFEERIADKLRFNN